MKIQTFYKKILTPAKFKGYWHYKKYLFEIAYVCALLYQISNLNFGIILARFRQKVAPFHTKTKTATLTEIRVKFNWQNEK